MIQTVTRRLREGAQSFGAGELEVGFSPKKALEVQTFSTSRRSSARKKEKYTSALKYIEFR